MAYQDTGVRILNLDECIKSVVDMSKISDSVEGRVWIDTEDVAEGFPEIDNAMYFIYQEFGFSVRSGEGFSYVPPKFYMKRAWDENTELIKQEAVKYLKSQRITDKGIQMYPFVKDKVEKIQKRAKQLAPKDTHRLKTSIQAETKVKE